MKSKRNKGCIYWDESSRGVSLIRPRGRWVGERLENGKRVRMRSTNYDNVLKWITGNTHDCNRMQIKGFPDYSIDIERKEVFGKRGQLMMGRIIGKKKVHYYTLFPDGNEFAVSFNRLAYAALHNIDPRKIPSKISVEYEDGEYKLMYLDEVIQKRKDQHRKEKRHEIKAILNKRKREIEILQRFYATGDSAELVTYATKDIFDKLVAHVMAARNCRIDRATDVVLDATEQFLHRAVESDVPIISISPTIQGLCLRALKNGCRKTEYNDNIRYKPQ